MTFKVTTPLFYAQIARYTSILEYINATLSKPDPHTATFYTSHSDLIGLFKLISSANDIFKMQPWSTEKPSCDKVVLSHTITLPPASLLDRIRWASIRLLRRLPSPHNRHSVSDLDACTVRLSTIDAPKARAYRKSGSQTVVERLRGVWRTRCDRRRALNHQDLALLAVRAVF